MVSSFYKNYSVHLLWLVALSFPFLYMQAETLPSNNDIETWLPRDADVRITYEQFKKEFGAEEAILIGVDTRAADARLIEALCGRIEALPGIRQCWSPDRLRAVMRELEVSRAETEERLAGLAVSADGSLIGLVALLTREGLADRAGTVNDIRRQIEYCQLGEDDVFLAGAPVVVSELDRLGNRNNNKKFFVITLLISLGLLYYTLRQWKLALSILGLTIWAINLNLATVKLAGGEMNFIMGALSVMVMVFTLAVSIHFLHYYQASLDAKDPLDRALRLAWKPCFWATLTTTIGLISLTVSDIAPVSQFGYAAAAGSLAALVTGLGLTPALLTVWPYNPLHAEGTTARWRKTSSWLLEHSKPIALATAALVLVTSLGLFRLDSKIDPLDFLPKNGKVLSDVLRIERDLTNASTIEAVVDFGDSDLPFAEKLREVQCVEEIIRRHPAVRHTMSVAAFLPKDMPDSPLAVARLLGKAQGRQSDNDFIADGERLWRISARINTLSGVSRQQTFDDLVAATAPWSGNSKDEGRRMRDELTNAKGGPTTIHPSSFILHPSGDPSSFIVDPSTHSLKATITFTGIAPLLDRAQQTIFNGFWESFSTAFGIITVLMVLALWSLKTGLVAMIPNLTPICIVFGTLGWCEFPVDIGMMMTGSIALGIAVDGTFHFLVRYEERYAQTKDSPQAAQFALIRTGAPIFQAGVIAAIGMLALTLSNFTPTARFGYMMSVLLVAALVGDLVVLPCLLYLRPDRRPQTSDSHSGAHAQVDFRSSADTPYFSERPARRPLALETLPTRSDK